MDALNEIGVLEKIKAINEEVGFQFNQIYNKLEHQFTDNIDHAQMVKFKVFMRRLADSGKIIWEDDGAIRITEFGIREISTIKNRAKVTVCQHRYHQHTPHRQTEHTSYPSTVVCSLCNHEITTSEYVAVESLRQQGQSNKWLIWGTWVMAIGTSILVLISLL